MKGFMNPFIISGYEGAEYFCDRVAETKQLASEIANGNNVALFFCPSWTVFAHNLG